MPNSNEVALYFVALPSALLIAAWLLVKAWSLAISKADSGAAAAAPNGANGSAKVADGNAEQERQLSIAIVSSAVRSAHGASAQELTDKLKANQAKLDLDSELSDSNGYPVFAGRVKTVDEQAQLAALCAWSLQTQRAELVWTSEQLRAGALAAEVLNELAGQAVKHTQLETYLAAQGQQRQQHESLALPVLQLTAILPHTWALEHRNYLSAWLAHLIEQQGWPKEKISVRSELPSSSSSSSSSSPSSPTQAVAAVDSLMLESFRRAQACFGIVIACESHIGEASVQRWEQQGKLCVGQDGITHRPGEAAAGLLLAGAGQMPADSSARLQRVEQRRRSKSADAGGQVSGTVLVEMLQDALANGPLAAEKISLICSDADQRDSRLSELTAMGYQVFPELDAKTQYFNVSSHCGEIGAVASLVALALAHHHVVEEAQAALCISNLDSHERTVALLSPWADASVLSA